MTDEWIKQNPWKQLILSTIGMAFSMALAAALGALVLGISLAVLITIPELAILIWLAMLIGGYTLYRAST